MTTARVLGQNLLQLCSGILQALELSTSLTWACSFQQEAGALGLWGRGRSSTKGEGEGQLQMWDGSCEWGWDRDRGVCERGVAKNGRGTATECASHHTIAGRQVDRQTDRQTGRQAGRQVGRQAGRQTDRQTERQTQYRHHACGTVHHVTKLQSAAHRCSNLHASSKM